MRRNGCIPMGSLFHPAEHAAAQGLASSTQADGALWAG